MRLKLAGRERRKLVCSPLDEPLASNRASDCLRAQFSWLKNLQRQPYGASRDHENRRAMNRLAPI